MRHEDELRDLYDIEHTRLFRTALLIVGDDAIADDIVAEAFARAAVRWWRLRRYDKPGAWLRLVVVRLAVRARERSERESSRATLPDAGHLDPPPPDPDLHAAIDRLPAPQRNCIVLHHLDELPIAEVAELLRMPEGTVRSHLHRGRARLAEELTPSEVTPRAPAERSDP